MIIYFAHPINTYNNDIDDKCVNIIHDNLCDKIINPSDDLIQSTFKNYRLEHPDTYMDFFRDIVSSCDKIVYLPFRDKKVGAGVWYEIKTVVENGGKVYEIDLESNTLNEVDFDYVNNNKLTIDETRIRIKTLY